MISPQLAGGSPEWHIVWQGRQSPRETFKFSVLSPVKFAVTSEVGVDAGWIASSLLLAVEQCDDCRLIEYMFHVERLSRSVQKLEARYLQDLPKANRFFVR